MKIRASAAAAASLLALGISAPLLANHSWGNYHWQHSSIPVTLTLVKNVTAVWEPRVAQAVAEWDAGDSQFPDAIDFAPVTNGTANPKSCKPTAGKIQVCNSTYGRTGWLGIAQIWASGSHITQGVTKVNDTYFNAPPYNTVPWRQLVMCQEIAHDFGLGHQDENFNNANLGSCMDYTNSPVSNQSPNYHDFEQIDLIYAQHLDSAFAAKVPGGSVAGAPSEAAGGNTPAEWGRATHFTADGRPDVYVQDIAPGRRKITHVFWALGEGPQGAHRDDH